MNIELLDFSICAQPSKCAKGELCSCFDLKSGNCSRCDQLCDVYLKYLTGMGTACDLLEFWAKRHSQSQKSDQLPPK